MMAKKIKRHYFGSATLPQAPFKKFIQMMGDHCFYGGIELTVRGILSHPVHAPVYQYIYSHLGSFTVADGFLLPPWKFVMKSLSRYSNFNHCANTASANRRRFSRYIGLDLFNRNLGVGHAGEDT